MALHGKKREKGFVLTKLNVHAPGPETYRFDRIKKVDYQGNRYHDSNAETQLLC